MAGGTIEGGVVGPGGIDHTRSRRPGQVPLGRFSAGVAAVFICVIVLSAVDGLGPMSPVTVDRVTLTLGVISKAVFLGAGIIQLAYWRISSNSRDLYWGAALVVLGGIALPLTSLATVVSSDRTGALLPPMTSVAIGLVTGGLVAMGVQESTSTMELRATPVLVMAGTTALLLFGVLVALHFTAPGAMHTTSMPAALPRGVALALLWAGLALLRTIASGRGPGSTSPSAALLSCLAAAELLRVAGVIHSPAWALFSAVVVMGVAIAASRRAHEDLCCATTAERESLAAAYRALHDAHVVAEQQHERQEEIEHDARNALAGLRAALLTIDRYGNRLDETTMGRLRRAALGEVHQLEHLIVNNRREPLVDFELEAVVSATVEARRANGSEISLLSAPCAWVRGRPADLATALDNLLVNADQHGATPISVSVDRVGDQIRIHVVDRGPGITADHAAAIFERGVKGPASRGNGLGLSVARSLMRRQGGDVELRSHTGGCVFTVRVPASDGARTEPIPAQVPAQRDMLAPDESTLLAPRRHGSTPS